jgi:hypothetical protein
MKKKPTLAELRRREAAAWKAYEDAVAARERAEQKEARG